MSAPLRWFLAVLLVVLLTVCPFAFYRCVYVHGKRLRVVTPGRMYRSGQMTTGGFTEAVQRYGIHMIVNLQDEYPDPDINSCCLGGATVKESELCRRLHVRYVFLPPDLISRHRVPAERPRAIDEMLRLLDDPANYPVLLHCRAGLHRTGVMVAVYRMEYEAWSPRRALQELRANGFGEWDSVAANDYIMQYILSYQRGIRAGAVKP